MYIIAIIHTDSADPPSNEKGSTGFSEKIINLTLVPCYTSHQVHQKNNHRTIDKTFFQPI